MNGTFLDADAKVELPKLGQSICQMYGRFAVDAVKEQKKLWKPIPKLHCFDHLCSWQALESGNPRRFWCYADEDLIGQLIDVAESCHASTLCVTAMFKWLHVQFAEFMEKLKKNERK